MINNSFIKQLKKVEVEEMLAIFGYKLHKNLFDEKNKPIISYVKTKNKQTGKYFLYLRCKKINSSQNFNNLAHFFYHEVDGKKIKLDNALFLIEDYSVKFFIGSEDHSDEIQDKFVKFMTNRFGYEYTVKYNLNKNGKINDLEF